MFEDIKLNEILNKLLKTDEEIFEQFIKYWMENNPNEVFNLMYNYISNEYKDEGSSINESWERFLKAETQKKINFLRRLDKYIITIYET